MAGDLPGHDRLRPLLREGVTMNAALLLLCLLVGGYLFYAMVRPERF
jgi:K+-transporting ATPase KdpF subunit